MNQVNPKQEKRKLWSQRTQLQHDTTLLLPFCELPLRLCIFIHNSIMLYIYLHMDAIRWVDVEVHAIILVEGVCVLLCQQLLLERTSVQMKLDKRQRGSYEIGQLMWRQPGTRANCLLSYVCA